MRLLVFPLSLAAACGCRTADPGAKRDDPTETTSNPAPTPDLSTVTLELATSTTDAKAAYSEAGFAPPSIVLTLKVKNGASVPVTLDKWIGLDLNGERGKMPGHPRIALATSVVVAAGASESFSIEAGREMVDIAAMAMKGDDLHVRVRVTLVAPAPALDVTSNEVMIHVFVPEG